MTANATPTVAPVLSTPDDLVFAIKPRSGKSHAHLSDDEFRTMYEVDRTVSEVLAGGYQRVALQFPDELLGNSERVYSLVQAGINKDAADGPERKLFILADTSYSACCVDEIAAEHAAADVLVHYGRSCLSPTSRLPVVYVLTTNPLDLGSALGGFRKTFPEKSEKVLVMADVTYDSHTAPLCCALREEGYENVFETQLVHCPGALLPNRTQPAEVRTEDEMRQWSLFHICEPLPSLQLVLASRVAALHYFDPSSASVESASTSPLLRRRYAVVSHAKSAGVIGILVNTLNIRHYLPMISHIKSQIRNAGRKSYLVVVGKVNVEKVANFSEIEAWVGIGCWEQGVVGGIDSRGWFRPVITPWELGIALGERQWTGGWVADFAEVLRIDGEKADAVKEGRHHQQEEDEDEDEDEEQDSDEDAPPEYDLRTGQYISTARPLGRKSKPTNDDKKEATSSALTYNRKKELIQSGRVLSPAAQFLHEKRTWQGLGSDYRELEVERYVDNRLGALVEEGRSGHASGYVVGGGSKH